MAYIEMIPDDEATGPAAEMFDVERRSLGYVPDYTRAFAHRPAIYAGWRELNRAIRGAMDKRRTSSSPSRPLAGSDRATALWPTAPCWPTSSWRRTASGSSRPTTAPPASTPSTSP